MGKLTIAPGSLAVVLDPLLKRVTKVPRVEHAQPSVTVVTSRLYLPLGNVTIVIEGREADALVSMPMWDRAPVIRYLRAAGFTVNEVKRWVWKGYSGPL
jgi:hypothetical protein